MINLKTDVPYADSKDMKEPEIKGGNVRRSTNDVSMMKKSGGKFMSRNASKIEYDRFDKNPVKIDKSDTGNGTSLPRIKQADFETSKALSNVIGNNKVDKDRTVSLVDINKPLVQITGKGVMQPSPFTKEQSPPGDPFAGKGKR